VKGELPYIVSESKIDIRIVYVFVPSHLFVLLDTNVCIEKLIVLTIHYCIFRIYVRIQACICMKAIIF